MIDTSCCNSRYSCGWKDTVGGRAVKLSTPARVLGEGCDKCQSRQFSITPGTSCPSDRKSRGVSMCQGVPLASFVSHWVLPTAAFELPAGTSSVPRYHTVPQPLAVVHDQLRLLEHDLDQLSPTADASAKALPAACVVCANDDPGVSEFQRCDGGCDRWFCIGGSCARDLGVMNYTRDMSGGDLVCGDCAEEAASVQKKLKTSSASITTALEQQEFREQ